MIPWVGQQSVRALDGIPPVRRHQPSRAAGSLVRDDLRTQLNERQVSGYHSVSLNDRN